MVFETRTACHHNFIKKIIVFSYELFLIDPSVSIVFVGKVISAVKYFLGRIVSSFSVPVECLENH